jgi:hypothetical protein
MEAFAKFSLAIVAFLSLASANACNMVDKRICEYAATLEKETGHKVTYLVDYSVRVASVEWVIGQPDIIHLGDTKELDDNALFFALAHEFGHSVMGHGRKYVESFAPASAKFESDSDLLAKYGEAARNGEGDRELNHSQEYAADSFAGKIMRKYGIDPAKALKALLKPLPATNTHPARSARVEKLREEA